MKRKKNKTKNILLSNIPNLLTISRFLLTFVIIYLIFTEANIIVTIIIFVIAAFSDFLDGQLARKFKWESEFGRKADMIADRFLWVGTALAFLITYGLEKVLSWKEGTQLLLIMMRELICTPYALIAFFSGNFTPKARYIAKVTTFIQGFALPALILSVFYPIFAYLSWPLAITTGITGFISAMYYMDDIRKK